MYINLTIDITSQISDSIGSPQKSLSLKYEGVYITGVTEDVKRSLIYIYLNLKIMALATKSKRIFESNFL